MNLDYNKKIKEVTVRLVGSLKEGTRIAPEG